MDGALSLPTPSNVRAGNRTLQVTSDVFHIADRVKEIDPNLYIYVLDPPAQVGQKTYNFAICEKCKDGAERLVYRVEELDGRVIERLQYMLAIPFEKRVEAAERWVDAQEEARKEAELMELYERMGRPMWTQLEHDGFIQRSRSFPKRGVKPR